MASQQEQGLPALSSKLPAGAVALTATMTILLVAAALFVAWRLIRWRQRRARHAGHDQEAIMTAETVSSIFPDRPIRPLPKRRLRERLSPEVAESIQYPPAPVSSVFAYPYSLRDEESDQASLARERATETEPRPSRRNGLGTESDEDDATLSAIADRTASDLVGRLARASLKTDHGRQGSSQLPLSAASSVDGYDSLENANNKKKRKVPSAGDNAFNGVHAISDAGISSTSLSSTTQSTEAHIDASVSTPTSYHGPSSLVSGTQNVPGPGRGRYARPRSGRSPLRPLSDSTNNWAGRNGKLRAGQWGSPASENTGIISSAIANAEKLSSHQGQENTSLLQQQLSTKRSPVSTQFTFTCDSQVPGSALAWPGTDRRANIGTHQPMPSRLANEDRSNGQEPPHAAPVAQTADATAKNFSPKGGVNAPNQPGTKPKNSRKSLEKEYQAAAKARRRETQLHNKRYPPKPEDIWICEFCEYESIFGHPPEALVRQYEIKDRKQRQLEQQRRAHLERMKKSKHKSKKNSKLPVKSTNATQDPQHATGAHGAPMNNNYSQGTSDEYYEDEEDDEGYEPNDEAPPHGGDTSSRPMPSILAQGAPIPSLDDPGPS